MFNKKLITIALLMVVTTVVWYTNITEAQPYATEGLISFWTFDKDTIKGDTVEDVWGENDGTIHGDPPISDGRINEAIEYSAGVFVSIDDPKDIPSGDDTYAIEAWFFANTAAGAKGIMGWGTWGAGNQVNALRLMNHGFRHYWWGNDLDWATDNITGEWHHIIAQFDGTTRSLWFDGEEITSDKPAGHNCQIADVNIGVTNNRTEFFDGIIDEVRLYDRGLTEDEILKNYKAESNASAVNPARKLSTCWGKLKDLN